MLNSGVVVLKPAFRKVALAPGLEPIRYSRQPIELHSSRTQKQASIAASRFSLSMTFLLTDGADASLISFAACADDHVALIAGKRRDEASHGVLLPQRLGHDLFQSCAALAFEQGEHRGLARSFALLGHRRAIPAGGLPLVAFGWAGALAGSVVLAASYWARSMSGCAISSSASSVSPRRWAVFQIRATALLRSVKRLASFSSA